MHIGWFADKNLVETAEYFIVNLMLTGSKRMRTQITAKQGLLSCLCLGTSAFR